MVLLMAVFLFFFFKIFVSVLFSLFFPPHPTVFGLLSYSPSSTFTTFLPFVFSCPDHLWFRAFYMITFENAVTKRYVEDSSCRCICPLTGNGIRFSVLLPLCF